MKNSKNDLTKWLNYFKHLVKNCKTTLNVSSVFFLFKSDKSENVQASDASDWIKENYK